MTERTVDRIADAGTYLLAFVLFVGTLLVGGLIAGTPWAMNVWGVIMRLVT